MAKLMESTKKNRIYLRKMFKGMGYDSFLDGFSESIQTNKGCFYLESIDFGEHEISNSDTDSNEKLTLNFRGDENSIPDMILRISNFFDKNNITIKHTIK